MKKVYFGELIGFGFCDFVLFVLEFLAWGVDLGRVFEFMMGTSRAETAETSMRLV